MKKEYEKLLKKVDLTGFDLGRIYIYDIVSLLTEGKSFIDEEKKIELAKRLTYEENMFFNRMAYMYIFICESRMHREYLVSTLLGNIEDYYEVVSDVYKCEVENKVRIELMPLVVTEEKFKEIEEQHISQEMKKTYTIEQLFFELLGSLIEQSRVYKAPDEFMNIVSAMASEPVMNNRIIDNYYSITQTTEPHNIVTGSESGYYSFKGKRIPNINNSKFTTDELQELKEMEILGIIQYIQEPSYVGVLDKATLMMNGKNGEYLKMFYSSEGGKKSYFKEFKEDYPSVYKYVWDLLKKNLKGIKVKDTFSPVITGEELSKCDIDIFKNKILNIKAPGYNSVAVIKSPDIKKFAYNEQSVYFKDFRMEKIIKYNFRINGVIDIIRNTLKEAYCYNAFLDLIKDYSRVEELELLKIDLKAYEDKIRDTNIIINRMPGIERNGTELREKDLKLYTPEEMNAIYKDLFKKIDVQELRPGRKLIKKYKKDLLNIILGNDEVGCIRGMMNEVDGNNARKEIDLAYRRIFK